MTVADLVQLAEVKIARLEKINQALMGRVERSMDLSGSAFSLFQAAILLEDRVKARTRDLESTVNNLSLAYVKLGEARDEAEKAKQNLTAAIEGVNEGFALFDRKERLVLCNSPFKALFPAIGHLLLPGLTFPLVANLFASAGVLILDQEQSAEEWVARRVQLFRQPYSSFIQALADDRWIQVSNRKMETGATVIFQTDITDLVRSARVRHEREIDEQSRLLQAMIDHLPQAVAMFGPNTTLRAWNRSFVDLLQLPLRQVFSGTRLGSLLRHLQNKKFEVAQATAETIRRWMEHPTASTLADVEIQRADGEILALSSQGMPDGGFVMTFTNVTRERNATMVLREANENLEQRVHERTQELTHEVLERREIEKELLRAKEAAEEANRSRTQFFAAASHDLLQPLNASRLFLSQLMESKLGQRELRLASNADKAFASAEQLLDSILDISRFESGSILPDFTIFPLDELFSTLIAEFRPIAARKGLALRAVHTAHWVRCDRALLRRVIQNFLSNAIRYTGRGKILLGCRRRGASLTIEVWDTGRGIHSSKFDLVFREFTRLESNNTQEPHAMGLGLAIVSRIAKLMGTEVELNSELGKGSCFAITLPRVPAEVWPAPAELKPTGEGRLANSKTILVIENDLAILEGMVGLLESRGFEVIPTVSGEEALEAVQLAAKPPDLLIADYHLDNGTGVAAVREVRAGLSQPVPTIIVTADRSILQEGEQLQENFAVLWKPIKTDALFREIATLLETP